MVGDGAWFRYFIALFLVVGLIFAVAWVARRLGFMGRLGAAGGRRRLNVIEVLPLDAKRRLVLLRRDSAEHLVLIGLTGDTVIERGIVGPSETGFAATLQGPP